jgi:hypothetical protein
LTDETRHETSHAAYHTTCLPMAAIINAPQSGSAERAERLARAWRLWVTAGPGLVWIVLFLVLPSLVLLAIGFFSIGDYGNPHLPLTLTPIREVAGYSILGWSPANITTIARSLLQAISAAGLTILLAYPGATIYSCDGDKLSAIAYKDTHHYNVTKDFLDDPERYLQYLFKD